MVVNVCGVFIVVRYFNFNSVLGQADPNSSDLWCGGRCCDLKLEWLCCVVWLWCLGPKWLGVFVVFDGLILGQNLILG